MNRHVLAITTLAAAALLATACADRTPDPGIAFENVTVIDAVMARGFWLPRRSTPPAR
jgi:hypothetical protein